VGVNIDKIIQSDWIIGVSRDLSTSLNSHLINVHSKFVTIEILRVHCKV